MAVLGSWITMVVSLHLKHCGISLIEPFLAKKNLPIYIRIWCLVDYGNLPDTNIKKQI